MKNVSRILVICVLLCLVTSCLMAGDLAVIVNKANSITSISAAQVSQIYSGRMTIWEDKVKIVPVIKN